MLHMPTPMLLGAGAPATPYERFVAYITGQATGGAKTWGADAGIGPGTYRTTAGSLAGSLTGSPWLSIFRVTFAPCRLVQHGLPDTTALSAQIAGVRQVLFRTVSDGERAAFPSLTRNEFTSGEYDNGPGGEVPALTCNLVLYWIGTDAGGSPFSTNPSSGTGPTPFVVPGP